MWIFSNLFHRKEVSSYKDDLFNKLYAEYKMVERDMYYDLYIRGNNFHISGGPSTILSVKKQYRDYKEWSIDNRHHSYNINNGIYYMDDDEVQYFIRDYSNFIDSIVTIYEETRELIRKAKSTDDIESIEFPDKDKPGYREWWTRYYTPIDRDAFFCKG